MIPSHSTGHGYIGDPAGWEDGPRVTLSHPVTILPPLRCQIELVLYSFLYYGCFHVHFILRKTPTIGDSMTQYACRTLEQVANFRRYVI